MPISEMASKTESDMLHSRNFGKKSFKEIKEKLKDLRLSLDMKIESSLLDKPL
jgi:DNA-directed RNA polymerase subunit alpha